MRKKENSLELSSSHQNKTTSMLLLFLYNHAPLPRKRSKNDFGTRIFYSQTRSHRARKSFLMETSITYNKITVIQILIINITGNEDEALQAIAAIEKWIVNKAKACLLYLHLLISLLAKFFESEQICWCGNWIIDSN